MRACLRLVPLTYLLHGGVLRRGCPAVRVEGRLECLKDCGRVPVKWQVSFGVSLDSGWGGDDTETGL